MRALLLRPLKLIENAAELADRFTAGAKQESGASTSEPQTAPAARRPRIGKHDEHLIALVQARPGLTVAETAEEMRLHPTALYPIIRRLEDRHQLAKIGRELHPFDAAATPGTELLWCAAGHRWARATTRGRKPLRCPKHR
jgi:hypothetical protein